MKLKFIFLLTLCLWNEAAIAGPRRHQEIRNYIQTYCQRQSTQTFPFILSNHFARWHSSGTRLAETGDVYSSLHPIHVPVAFQNQEFILTYLELDQIPRAQSTVGEPPTWEPLPVLLPLPSEVRCANASLCKAGEDIVNFLRGAYPKVKAIQLNLSCQVLLLSQTQHPKGVLLVPQISSYSFLNRQH